MTSLDIAPRPSARPTAPDRSAASFVPREKRHTTMLLVARIVLETGEDQLCRIRNISPGGLMLESSATLRSDQKITIQLRDLCALAGTVVWVRAPNCGIKLDPLADVPELLRSITAKSADASPAAFSPAAFMPRSPRLSSECPIKILSGGRPAPARMLDLSQRGAKLHVPDRKLGEQVTLKIPGLEPQQASVRWVRDEEAGVAFFETLGYRQLDSWLQQRSIRYAALAG